jgi:DNA primase
MSKSDYTSLDIDGLELRLSNPAKPYFPQVDGRPAITKLELAEYYLACADAVLLGVRERPVILKRWVNGIDGEPFYQKRVPEKRPEWLQTTTVTFPSGRSATELTPVDTAHLMWGVNLGNIDWNPWPVRRADVDHPDELRIDLDRSPTSSFATVREVAMTVRDVLTSTACAASPRPRARAGSTSTCASSRVGTSPRSVARRRAAREVERRCRGGRRRSGGGGARRRVPRLQPERPRRTIASAYSVRAVADARVSCGLEWDEVPDVSRASCGSTPSATPQGQG